MPKALSTISLKLKTPHWAIVSSGVISVIALCTGTTDAVVIISVMGAIVMYGISMISLFMLRRKEPLMQRPFTAPLYPLFPAIALLISGITLGTMIYFNFKLSLFFFAGMGIAVLLFVISGKHKEKLIEEHMQPVFTI